MLEKWLRLNLRVQAPGIATRSHSSQGEPLQQRNLYAVAREIVGGRTAGNAAANDDDIGQFMCPNNRKIAA